MIEEVYYLQDLILPIIGAVIVLIVGWFMLHKLNGKKNPSRMKIWQRFKIWRIHRRWWKQECKPYKEKVNDVFNLIPIAVIIIILGVPYLVYRIVKKTLEEDV